MVYIIIAILMFGVLIAVHEFGHFITAKLLGVKVNEFAIGMGPLLVSRQKGETLYALRAFPIGGFCAMEGEEGDSADPRSFERKSAWRKVIILAAGSFMNFLTGLLILMGLFMTVGQVASPVVTGFLDGFPVQEVGLQPGDRIVSIEGHRVRYRGEIDALLDQASADGRVDLVVRREGETVTLAGQPLVRRTFNYEGEQRQMYGLSFGETEAIGPIDCLILAWRQSVIFAKLVWESLGMLVRGAVGLKDLSGPIGIVNTIGQVGASAETPALALQGVMQFVAFIAINLAVMNLLPIPALDGGRIFFLAINLLVTFFTKKKLDPKYENAVNMAGFFCLLALMAVVAVSDIFKLIH
ncbi:RIP metalloprotease [Pseudoflavonifractor sp. 524-17]|uniref:M50 family metallopeptidase n=1 Tax=Pseudoflavonifractor sp. 524-17 TaxID=2304577 RepID=UPI00137AD16C|nr:M50 family metallopeptidase [Pseudoflavonifractor sp. 524-17]NCE64250.1 RIP metalloprotease [Pseudoflavonifractor sp. 524-17]